MSEVPRSPRINQEDSPAGAACYGISVVCTERPAPTEGVYRDQLIAHLHHASHSVGAITLERLLADQPPVLDVGTNLDEIRTGPAAGCCSTTTPPVLRRLPTCRC